MRFPRWPARRKRPSPVPHIRSLDDVDGHFPWPDLGMGGRALDEVRNPLAVAVRALKVVEYSVATADENDGEGGMALLGLAHALHGLAKHGEWDAVATLLNALESLMDPMFRRKWVEGLDPYIQIKEPGTE